MQKNYSHFFFIGIGGIGMSAIARYFNTKGFAVAGYDRTVSPLTTELAAEGMSIFYEDNTSLIPEAFKNTLDCLVIYTPAIPSSSELLMWFRTQLFTIQKRAEVLGYLTKTQQSICISGTHGKTTISTMTGHLIYASHVGCNAFLGGISQNYKSNLLSQSDSSKVVIEADEFDRSFLHLHPHSAVISSIDADHLDIYGTHEQLIAAFETFSSQIIEGGILIYKSNLHFTPKVKKNVRTFLYNINDGDFHAANLELINGLYHFDFVTPERTIPHLTLGVPGKVNVENAIAALSLAYLHGVKDDELRTGLASFKGIVRRFQYHIQREDLVYIDDYAHHPQELEATINSVREIYPDKKITGIFQPHLYSRTQDFASEFAKALSLLDELWLMPIYPARELPIAGVTSDLIIKDVTCPCLLVSCEQIEAKLKESPVQVLLTLGAGDIDRMITRITHLLSNN